jgi:exosortase/archaeosortase family protein
VALTTLAYLVARKRKETSETGEAKGAAQAQSGEPTETTGREESAGCAATYVPLIVMLALYGLSIVFLPKLISAALALITLALGLRPMLQSRFNPGHWLLLLLSLPIVASLNFYLGYPLRLMVAQMAVSLLSINGFPVTAEGTSLLWHSQLIEIDAPCSGIKMLWAALYMAAVQLSLRKWESMNSTHSALSRQHVQLWQTALYLTLAIAAAIFANTLRVTSLFYLEAGIISLPTGISKSYAPTFESAVHTGTGIAAFLLVALLLFFADKHMTKSAEKKRTEDQREKDEAKEKVDEQVAKNQTNTDNKTSVQTGRRFFFIACVTAAFVPFFSSAHVNFNANEDMKWPTVYEGQNLKPIALSGSEATFANNFPGKIAMFKTDTQTVILRRVNQATRQLHPAADCYRASGFTIKNLPHLVDQDGKTWNVMLAQKATRKLEVRERIYDGDGQNFVDVSRWYWSAFWGTSKGPWWSVTAVKAIDSQESRLHRTEHSTNYSLR